MNQTLENLLKDDKFHIIVNKTVNEVPYALGIFPASESDYNQPKQVINYNWNDYWCSLNTQNNWLEIHFKMHKVKIN